MFRVGDIVERIGNDVFGQKTGKQYAVSDVGQSGFHISVEGGEIRYSTQHYKLIKPLWKVGDTAKIIKSFNPSRIDDVFRVVKVDGTIYEKTGLEIKEWTPENIERVALAPEPSVQDLVKAGILPELKSDGTLQMTIKANEFTIGTEVPPELKTTLARELEIPTYLYDVVEAGFLPELKTTLARELEIPTYLYDVVDVKPRLKSGSVQVGATTVDISVGHNGVSLFNLNVNEWSADDLRKLAKLCTDLADLMG